MRVLTVSNMYPPHALGGYEMSCADVMTRFRERGHDVRVLTTTTQLATSVGAAADVDVERSFEWYWHDHQLRALGRAASWRLDRRNRARLRHAIAEFRPDVVSFWAMGGMSLSLLDVAAAAGVAPVWVICDEWPIYAPRIDRHAAFHRQRLPAPGNATICWVSEFVRDHVVAATGWAPARETVTHSGINLADFPLAAARDRAWQWRLLAVGRVEPRKGFAAAVEALAKLPAEATLRIVGPDDGAHGAELRRRAAELGVGARVSFDVVPRAQLRAVYDEADALLFTSAWEEPFGLVPVEAMARATPVVAVPTGGAREFLVDGTNCVTVAGNDGDLFSAAVRRLADDAALRSRVVVGGLSTAGALTTQRLADVLEEAHQAAIA